MPATLNHFGAPVPMCHRYTGSQSDYTWAPKQDGVSVGAGWSLNGCRMESQWVQVGVSVSAPWHTAGWNTSAHTLALLVLGCLLAALVDDVGPVGKRSAAPPTTYNNPPSMP